MRVALVTGSSRGIGLAILKQLVQDGFTCVMTSTKKTPETDELAKSLGVRHIVCNIGDTESRKALFSEIEKEYGRLDLVVNNAGTAPKQRLDILETTEENFDGVVSVNQRGTFFMCQLAANFMLAHKQAGEVPRIINISSISAFTSSVNRGEYCIAKAGISMTTKLFADRLAEEGIPVFEVQPGIIKTDMTKGVQEKYDALIAGGVTPIKRWGLPQDIADAVSVLASGKLDFATGQVIHADGGFHIRRL